MKHALTDAGLLLFSLFLLLVIVRLSAIAPIPWIWVAAPLWLPAAIALLVLGALLIHFRIARKKS